nr:hypothetical protein [Angustibacter aerolatus]
MAAGETTAAVPETVRVERPRNREHGDWATNVAMQAAKAAGVPPRDLATVLARRLGEVPGVKSVEVAGPGFLNIVLDAASAGEPGPHDRRASARPTATACWPRASGWTSSSSRPTRPARCTSAASGGRPWATRWPASCRRRGRRSPASTTSTTTGRRSTASRARCWPAPAARRRPRTATAARTSPRSPRR